MDRGITKSEQIRSLAAKLLEDIELVRLKPEQLLLKTRRLARLQENEVIHQNACDLALQTFLKSNKISFC